MTRNSRNTPLTAVVGGGQAGLAVGWYLRRTGLDFVVLDAEDGPGGAWRHAWDGLRLFSPAQWSSLPGWPMPGRVGAGGDEDNPTRDEVIDYLARYEERYGLPVERPVMVGAIRHEGGRFAISTDRGERFAERVVSATGTWRRPFVPEYPGCETFQGLQVHSSRYRTPSAFAGMTVLVVGGGNSGAQILAEVSRFARTVWVTERPPTFLPDDVDGRELFRRASERVAAARNGGSPPPSGGPGDIVMVPTVREARGRGVLQAVAPFARFAPDGVVWRDGTHGRFDAVIWCTGFRPALDHLRPLGVVEADGTVEVRGTRSVREPRLWLVGYGGWTGPASATLIGVGRTARATAAEIASDLAAPN